MATTLHLHSPKHDNSIVALLILWGLLLISFFFTGCSPEKRISRILKNHPELAKTKDSLIVRHDTTYSKEIHKDSVITNIYSKDTIYIHDGKETVKYEYMGGSKAYISGTVAPDTIIRIDSVKTKTTTLIQQVERPKDFWYYLTFFTTLAVFIYFAGKYALPEFNKILSKIPGWPF